MCASCHKSLFFIDNSCLISERNLTLKGVLVAISTFACSQKEMESVDFNAARAKDEHIPTGVTGEVPKLFTCENATETQLGVPRAPSYIKPGHPPPPKAMGKGMEKPGWETLGAPGSSWDVAQTQRQTQRRSGAVCPPRSSSAWCCTGEKQSQEKELLHFVSLLPQGTV